MILLEPLSHYHRPTKASKNGYSNTISDNLLNSHIEKKIDKEQPQQQGIKLNIYYQYSTVYKTNKGIITEIKTINKNDK